MECVHLWHRRLGHHNLVDINKLTTSANGISIGYCKNDIFDMIYRTCASRCLWTIPSKLKHRKKIFVTFIDDFSHYTKVYVIVTKNEVNNKFKEFLADVQNFTNKKLKILCCDNDGEFVNNEIKKISKNSFYIITNYSTLLF